MGMKIRATEMAKLKLNQQIASPILQHSGTDREIGKESAAVEV